LDDLALALDAANAENAKLRSDLARLRCPQSPPPRPRPPGSSQMGGSRPSSAARAWKGSPLDGRFADVPDKDKEADKQLGRDPALEHHERLLERQTSAHLRAKRRNGEQRLGTEQQRGSGGGGGDGGGCGKRWSWESAAAAGGRAQGQSSDASENEMLLARCLTAF